MTLTAWGVPNTSEWGTKLEVAKKWAGRLYNPCRLGGLLYFRPGDEIGGGPQVGLVGT